MLPLLGALTLQSCLKDKCTSTRNFIRFDPVYKPAAECRKDLVLEAPHALKNTGKLYAFSHYLLINEVKAGIHLIDNSDPKNPVQLAFWNIEGNVDMAVKGQYLYVDQYMDLLTIDISDLQNPKQVCRQENEFSLYGFDPYRGFIIDYIQTPVTEEVACNDVNNGGWFFQEDVLLFDASLLSSNSSGQFKTTQSALAQAGIAGSFSRFGLSGDYLYTVDQTTLRSYSLNNPVCPDRLDAIQVGGNIETIFPWKDRLFIGSPNGVFIFNNSNPAHPVWETAFWHATGCDPVVCDDKYAYVTIHDGTTCGGTLNQLEVIGIEYLPQTTLFATYPMTRPMGLTFTDNNLYVCDNGLKVFDKNNPNVLTQLAHVQNIETYDVIALDNNHLLVIGAGGFYQYDVSDPARPEELSKILVQQ